ncbi:inositol-pentakisphosphate 2-kinase isoform X1 [Drosophila albomicans]|uniref:inositol-pentakisphosphate 2-kinase n=2 Tax=Drosophila albomicans TaxID=7291 RepID=A0A9C6SUJ6_DROAB|nr:inositol-pentakisphosphate 2-kinase isoform X1 [Drosophila albomicans]
MTAIEATTTRTTTAAAAAKTLNSLLQLPAQMELSQIELIYRAEGNANLVLALPQFKKVLRLPKMISNRQQSHNVDSQDSCQSRPEKQPNVSDPTKAGVLTMPDFMAYIEIMRRLLGNEFVCEPDIVAIPKQSDRFWINEHIRAHRPVARLDKEFVGPFGLMLPDVTQLPATFDVLLANLQAKDMNTDMNADICNESNEFSTRAASSSSSKRSADDGGGGGGTEGISRLGDTYAIEIKPKQGWLQLASDVSDLFDLMPTGAKTMDTTSDVATSCNRTNLLASGGERLTELTPDKCRCRYCSMQHLKLQTGKIKRLGEYCPMELFSGTPGRMVNALNALFACPQNNLRVFQRGNLIYGDHANSISCDELHTRVFPGEIMALIKHLLVACLLREYGNNTNEMDQQQQQQQPEEGGAAVGCGMKTKATETTTESGATNVDAAVATAWHEHETETRGQQQLAGIVEFVKAVAAGQPQQEQQQQQQQRRCSTRAAAEKATQRYTKRSRTATSTATTTSTAATCCESTTRLSTNVAMAATRTETETLPTATSPPTTTTMMMATPTPNPNKTRAQINKAEIFHLPKNCVLQKILHLQLLVKRHFHYMWQTGQAQHATPSYAALRALLSRCQQEPALALALDNVDQLAAEEAYMLGATALDCSIMLTFQEIRCQPRHNSLLQPWLVTLQGRQFLTKLSVLDLDPKPDSHFHKFVKQMREIEKCCRALN